MLGGADPLVRPHPNAWGWRVRGTRADQGSAPLMDVKWTLRYFFRRDFPADTKILLIESGSRHLIENVVPTLRRIFPANTGIDLVTCYPGVPRGFDGKVYRITDYRPDGRHQLLADLAAGGYTLGGIICSGEPIMTKWKWWLAAKLPLKFFVLNENGDLFWCDWGQWRTILHFATYRAGLSGSAAVPTIIRFLLFPLTLGYLILYACTVHIKRKLRTP